MSHMAIVGLGHVGLPLALQFARSGAKVLGLDIDPTKTEMILAGRSYIKHVASEEIAIHSASKALDASTDFSRVAEADAVILCVPTRFIELAGEINTAMPDHVVKVCFEALSNDGKSIKAANILLLGLAYKANVGDDRESPTYKLIDKFEALGGEVFYHDPHVPVIPMTRAHAEYAGRKSVAEIADLYDLIVLSTDHDGYKSHDFSGYACPLVDTRNAIPVANRPVKYHRA